MSDHSEYSTRIADAYQRIRGIYEHRDDGVLPFLVADVKYSLSGESPELIPDDYFTNSESMLRFQLGKIDRHMQRFDDDYIPFLFPWYGTVVLASGFGSEVVFERHMDPAISGTVIKSPGEVSGLSLPDPRNDGLMPRVLETIRHFRAHTDLPISFTDPQGPFTTALTLVGPTEFFVWMYEYPARVHELMEICTEAFIRWMKAQKREIGEDRGQVCFPHGIVLPREFGSVWLSDDDCVAISAEQYREFVVPYNSRIFTEFGGGTLHFCGSAGHQLENFLQTDGLVGINNFCMGDFEQVYRMQELFRDRLGLMVCDFTPLHIAGYYHALFRRLRRRGTVLASYVSPKLALNDQGKYEMQSRNGEAMAREVYEVLRGLR